TRMPRRRPGARAGPRAPARPSREPGAATGGGRMVLPSRGPLAVAFAAPRARAVCRRAGGPPDRRPARTGRGPAIGRPPPPYVPGGGRRRRVARRPVGFPSALNSGVDRHDAFTSPVLRLATRRPAGGRLPRPGRRGGRFRRGAAVSLGHHATAPSREGSSTR